ncbi:MAG: tetratricopeptide repeat protein, partial [Nannocystaceae bacterium]|nr:tetratricopeptide repeat protein [Nannocystaceae bacterium]
DFKPDNVLVAEDGPRVADFGLARATTAPSTKPGGGSPAYMAPERLEGGGPTEAADQFALAVTLVEALGGARPFLGGSLAMRRPPKLPDVVLHNARVLAAVRRGLAPEPGDRHPCVEAFVEALAPPPAGRGRRWTVVGAVGVAVAGVSLWGGSRDKPCDGGAAVLALAYAPQAAERVRSAVDAQLGEGVAAPALHRLDAYARTWVDAHREVCTATQVDGVQSDSMFDRRMQCLMRRHVELKAVTDALGGVSSPREAERGSELVDALLDPAGCDTAHSAQGPASPSAQETAVVTEVRADMATAWADYRLARYTEALQRAQDLDAAARRVSYVPLQAEAALLLGTAQGRSAGFAESEATLRRARVLAAQAGAPALAADISTQLLRTLMFAGQPARVADLCVYARADVLEAGRQSAEIDGIVGESQLKAGELMAARASIERALAQEHRAPQRALLLVNRASAALEQGKATEALRDYRAAYELAAAHYGPSHPRMGFFVHRVGRGQLAAGDAVAAAQTLERALGVREAVLGPDDRAVASVLADLSEARRALGETEVARALLARGLEIRRHTLGPRHPRTVELDRRFKTVFAPDLSDVSSSPKPAP